MAYEHRLPGANIHLLSKSFLCESSCMTHPSRPRTLLEPSVHTHKIVKSHYPVFATLDSVWSLYPNLRGDCSGYVKRVARDLGVIMSPGDANAIIVYLRTSPRWLQLGHDPVRAAQLAGQGYFVVGGEAEARHGHVVVVVPGWSVTGHPMGYWGMLNGIGAANASLSRAWVGDGMWNRPREMRIHPHKMGAPSPLDDVLYFALPLKTLEPVSKK
jgi:hypothetical protein